MLLGRVADAPAPGLVVCVVDAVHLPIGLRLALEVKRLGLPMVLALNRMDVARRRGVKIDIARLSNELGVPVLPTVAVKRGGADALIEAIEPARWPASQRVGAPALARTRQPKTPSRRRRICAACSPPSATPRPAKAAGSARVDAVLLHPVAGILVLAVVMFLIFQAVFSWADAAHGLASTRAWARSAPGSRRNLGDGPLSSLLADGVIAGAGAVLVFLPQIVILFFFILVLEDSGYLPRAAYLLDRLMGWVGLSGRAFIPLLSSHACAIPGIMATRTIPSWRDRLTTIMVAPLMTCSARLPVYVLLIGAFIPRTEVGPFNLQGLVMFGLYVAGIVSSFIVAFVMKQFAGARALFAADARAAGLPVAGRQQPVARPVGARAIFVSRVGGIILALMIVLWFLAAYPAPPPDATGPRHPVQLRRPARRHAAESLRAHRLQLADLDRAGAGPRGARSRGRCARHGLRHVRQR